MPEEPGVGKQLASEQLHDGLLPFQWLVDVALLTAHTGPSVISTEAPGGV